MDNPGTVQSRLSFLSSFSGSSDRRRRISSPEKARERVLKDMFAGGGPQAFSGDEMRLRLSLPPENELRKLSRLCTVPGLSMLRTAPAV